MFLQPYRRRIVAFASGSTLLFLLSASVVAKEAQPKPSGTVTIHPKAKTGAHHHGHVESVIYVIRGKARMRWGDRLEFTAEAGPGDFIYVPPYVPHQEINADPDVPCEAVVVRSGQDPVVVNLDIESPEPASEDTDEKPFHPKR